MPVGKLGTGTGDGYGYDIAINPARNVILTSSFAGSNNYMRDLGEVVGDPAAMKQFGNTMVMWDLKAMKPSQVFEVPGAPLEIRWSLKPGDNWAITATALTSKLWLIRQDAAGQWQAREVGTIGDPAKIPLPVDISIAADGKGLWVNTFMDGTTHYFDISNPEHPVETYAKQTGKQVNMISQSWDGKRVYITSSLLSKWDKKGADDEQIPARLQLGRQGAHPRVRNRLQGGEARSPASHEVHGAAGGDSTGRTLMRLRAFVTAAVAWLAAGGLDAATDPGRPLEPRMEFVPPAAGTYELQRIQRAPDAELLDANADVRRLVRLHDAEDHAAHVLLHVLRRPVGLPFRVPDVDWSAGSSHRGAAARQPRPLRQRELRSDARHSRGACDSTAGDSWAIRVSSGSS